ncbi:Site-specific recombinase XerD [Streptomyces sp. DvalAA-14]|uniref:tyrosine-type recombinase/integrase n=1 Tax=unclassified Streptomyces TaxID=2593676 RepID=UPI00081B60BB|nr:MULTISPECIES: site-specific integrase [unclassified Streptomyces]MYS22053.1 tyrosine-type recombinase/integrase [Streptomyces sp. SID4948]SCE07560.1 Site-specific recombinase XerD [Streptomyces sp. DvalAA-14]
MAGHIQDRWYKTEQNPDGKTIRVKTDRYGTGMRYRARYIGPDGTELSKSFPDRQRRLAEEWLAQTNADMTRGTYVDPKAGRTTFRQFTLRWLNSQTTDLTTQVAVETRLRLHVLPRIGTRPLDSFRPSHIQALVKALEDDPMSGGYARIIYGNVRAVLSAAVDDGLLNRNPCNAKSVRPPAISAARLVPWLPEQVLAVRAALPQRYRAMVDVAGGCGLRQGEIIGLAEDDAIDFEAGTLHVVRQVKLIRGKAVFAPPKCNKERDVPLPGSVAAAIRSHVDDCKPVAVTLPWKKPDGPLVTKRLYFSNQAGGIVWRSNFNIQEWKPALAAAGLIPTPELGKPYDSAREHGMHALRHFYASVLLDAGESIKAVSEYLGHADPALTLRVYAHLMPSSRERARRAIDRVFVKS